MLGLLHDNFSQMNPMSMVTFVLSGTIPCFTNSSPRCPRSLTVTSFTMAFNHSPSFHSSVIFPTANSVGISTLFAKSGYYQLLFKAMFVFIPTAHNVTPNTIAPTETISNLCPLKNLLIFSFAHNYLTLKISFS